MIITTTQYIEGRHILEYKGIVCGAIRVDGAVFKVDIEYYRKTYGYALNQLENQAVSMGANAVIGIQSEFPDLGGAITVTGTAVFIE